MRVLFVKLTSMGDLIHALPALTDAKRAIPNITFDWVIEKNFSEVASWHPAVNTIIPASHRKWKKNFWQSIKNGEIKKFITSLRRQKYDLVIDGQTSSKSAVVMLLTRGLRCGLDKHSASEWIAHFAYQKKYPAGKELHAIKRLRLLFSQALNYQYDVHSQPDYGIENYPFPELKFSLPERYVVFVHNASWTSKLWIESYWHQLIDLAANDNLHVVLPWGNETEKKRAEALATEHKNAIVLPFLSLSEQATVLKRSQGAVSCDTGLSHLAAALNVPSVTLYGSTSIQLIGTTGLHQSHFVSPFECTLCYKYDCHFGGTTHNEALCMLEIKPESVWEKFKSL